MAYCNINNSDILYDFFRCTSFKALTMIIQYFFSLSDYYYYKELDIRVLDSH